MGHFYFVRHVSKCINDSRNHHHQSHQAAGNTHYIGIEFHQKHG